MTMNFGPGIVVKTGGFGQPTNHSFIHSSMLSSYSRVSIDFFVYGEKNDEKEGFVPVSLLCCST